MKACLCVSIYVLVSCSAACERERRPFDSPAAAAERTQKASMTSLHAGAPPPPPAPFSPFQQNAYGIGEGKRLYSAFNCVGCHSHGGGGMGPALMDDQWIYGSRPENIFNTIVEGRPNGMPAWRNKITDEQVWQLVAYVQSMNGQVPIDALPGRDDHLSATTPENARPAATPVETGKP
jgi:cytochrome c oxidase cbb3-type subunit III